MPIRFQTLQTSRPSGRLFVGKIMNQCGQCMYFDRFRHCCTKRKESWIHDSGSLSVLLSRQDSDRSCPLFKTKENHDSNFARRVR
jgi:hypothetical protein